jgi:hypothetical protein
VVTDFTVRQTEAGSRILLRDVTPSLVGPHTILSKSRTYTSLVLSGDWLGVLPPNNTAQWSLIIVREKSLQGGGLVPSIVGAYHVPEEIKTA